MSKGKQGGKEKDRLMLLPLVQVFDELLRCKAFPMKERMRCLLSVVEIIHEQGDALNIDRRSFYIRLYSALLLCPLHQLADSPLDDAAADSEVVTEDDLVSARRASSAAAGPPTSFGGADWASMAGEESVAVLVAKAATAMLTDMKIGDIPRLAAFAKRLSSLALHASTDLSIACLSLVNRYATSAEIKVVCCFHVVLLIRI